MHTKSLTAKGRVLIAVLALATPVGLGAVASSADAGVVTSNTFTVLVGNQASHMAIQGQRFLPGDITIDAGDKVTWQANAGEPHTVTFFNGGEAQDSVPEFNLGNTDHTQQQGPNTMAPDTYYNSGVLTTLDTFPALQAVGADLVKSYTLTFPTEGTYTYYCLVHGIMMRGEVHVQPTGAAYPADQSMIDSDAAWLASAIVADGKSLWKATRAKSTNHKVFTGADDGVAMVMRFIRGRVVIHKGQKVHFVNTMSMGAPHTVTFGPPVPPPNTLAAYGHPNRFKGGQLSSGFMVPHQTFTVTFKKVGKFPYYCLLHSELGMHGVVIVKP